MIDYGAVVRLFIDEREEDFLLVERVAPSSIFKMILYLVG